MNGVAAPYILVPTLVPGDQAPLGLGVEQAIEAAGATRLLLPPYSPDFNPIEQAFAKLKALLTAARTVDDLWDAIAEIIEPHRTECANFFANSGLNQNDRKML